MRIATLAVPVDAPTLPIVEIGPGTGALTRALLAAGAKVTAIEIDGDLIALLRDDATLRKANFEHADALSYDEGMLSAVIGTEAYERGAWVATGNLPYNIGTPLLLRWVEAKRPPERIVVMLQRDVVDRLVAVPGTPAYGSLSITTELVMHRRRAFTLRPAAFYPQPQVDSSVVFLERREIPLANEPLLGITRRLARAGFAYRRKTFANSVHLALGMPRESVAEALVQAGLSADVRAEHLRIDSILRLADILKSIIPGAKTDDHEQ